MPFLPLIYKALSRLSYDQARRAGTTHQHDCLDVYIGDLAQIIDVDLIRFSRVETRHRSRSAGPVWPTGSRLAERYGLNIELERFWFMSLHSLRTRSRACIRQG